MLQRCSKNLASDFTPGNTGVLVKQNFIIMEKIKLAVQLSICLLIFSIVTINCSKEESKTKTAIDTVKKNPPVTQSTSGKIDKLKAKINPLSGSGVEGTIEFTKIPGGVRIVADVKGLAPGMHGFHIHEKGDCSSPDGKSAGDHFNPGKSPHAGHDSEIRHEGDLGNIKADEKGNAHLELTDTKITFDGPNSIVGRSVIVHEKEDDLTTQPSGNAGARLACGVIEVVAQ